VSNGENPSKGTGDSRNAGLLPRERFLMPRKGSGKHGHGRKSSHPGAQTSAQELAVAKPLKRSMKFAAKSSRLSPGGWKMSSASTGRGGATHAWKCALNLFGSDSSASDAEAALSEWPRKRPRESSVGYTKILFRERYFQIIRFSDFLL
jgi:hypothetical protein